MKMRLKQITVLAVVLVLLALAVTPALAKGPKVGFGELYYEGDVVRTVVPPAAAPKTGIDPLYVIQDGAEGQLPIAAVAPGDRDYHGGKWAVYVVSWNTDTDPYLLTSAEEVRAAKKAGDVTVTRVPENDFKCPIQP